jgi:hypothetical protein
MSLTLLAMTEEEKGIATSLALLAMTNETLSPNIDNAYLTSL